MSSNQLTILDLKNILKWYEIAKNTDNDSQLRSYLKIKGMLIVNEDLCEPIIHDLIGNVMKALDKVNYNEIQFPNSLLKIRQARLN